MSTMLYTYHPTSPPYLGGVRGGLVLFLILYSLFLIPKPAEAGLIMGAPKYAGLSQGLVGFWSFNGPDMNATQALDRSGNANNGTLTNGPTRTIGKLGQALSFDGSSNYINIGTQSSLDLKTKHSVSAWVKTNAINVTQAIFSHGGAMCCGSEYGLWIRFDGGGGTYKFFAQNNLDGVYFDSNQTVIPNRWYFLTYTWDGSTESLYVDGVLDASRALSGTITEYSNRNGIGAGVREEVSSYFSGIIDDVRVYNRALTGDEIKRLYRIGATLKMGVSKANDTLANGLVGWWTFDGPDMAGNTAYDKSPFGNKGILTNGPTRTIGKICQALSFDGVDDSVQTVLTDSVSRLNFTWSAWIFINSIQNTQNIIMTGSSFIDGIEVTNTGAIKVYVDGAAMTSNSVITAGGWHLVTATYDGAFSVYIDGIKDSATGGSGTFDFGNCPYIIGARAGSGCTSSPTNFLNGKIDDVRVYNRALTGDEIKRLYRIGATLKMGVSKANDTLANGLVGWWTFDGPDMAGNTAYDKSPFGNKGILTNGPTRTIGKLGQALSFDGSNDYVDMGAPSSLNNLPMVTVSAWIYATSDPNNYMNLVKKGREAQAQFDSNFAFNFINITGNSDSLLFVGQYDSGNGNWDNNVKRFASTNSIVLNTWNHIVATWGGSSSQSDIHIYINGVEVSYQSGTDGTGTRVNDSGRSFTIGSGTIGSDSFPGKIDDVRIYNRALSPDEIKRLYNLGH